MIRVPLRTALFLALPSLLLVPAACGDDETAASTTTGAGAGGTASTTSVGGSGGGTTSVGGGGGAVATVAFQNPPENVVTDTTPLTLDFEPAAVEIGGNRYCLRTWNGSVPAPTIRVPASASARSIRVDVNNTFTQTDIHNMGGMQHDYNATNLHTHGLHVQPNRSSDDNFYADNVLLHMMPGASESFRFDIDEDYTHEDGTFWYHPHVHGATGIQVGNGMAGALIIEGETDEVAGIADAEERIFILQHIAYQGRQPLGDGEACTENNLSINDGMLIAGATNVLVNGLEEPQLTIAPGSVERWRMVHAGVTNEMTLRLRPSNDDDCGGFANGDLDFHQIAADGITFQAKWSKQRLFLAPGYRADVMVEAPATEGLYCLVAEMPAGPGMMADALVATVRVDASAGTASGGLPSDTDLAAIAKPTLDCSAAVDGTQVSIFAQVEDENGQPCEGTGPGPGPALNINCKTYDANSPRVLTVDNFEEWTLSSENGDHPFHIHVNPFTVCSNAINGETAPFPIWRDTLLIRQQDGDVRMRTVYETFTGDFVTHCHKLNHEDAGMMERISVQ